MKTIHQCAVDLAQQHAKADPNMREIYLVPYVETLMPLEPEIRLIEVTTAVPHTSEVMPFRFAATEDVPYRTVIVLLNPADWVERSRLQWPDAMNPSLTTPIKIPFAHPELRLELDPKTVMDLNDTANIVAGGSGCDFDEMSDGGQLQTLEFAKLVEHAVLSRMADARRRRLASPEDRNKWNSYLASLGNHESTNLGHNQVVRMLDCWQRALEADPNVKYPTSRHVDDPRTETTSVHWTWGIAGVPGKPEVLEVEFGHDCNEWFYLDGLYREGSETECSELPSRFYELLRRFSRGGPRVNRDVKPISLDLDLVDPTKVGQMLRENNWGALEIVTSELVANIHEIVEAVRWQRAFQKQEPDLDPADSLELRWLRHAIDTELGWANEADQEGGDYLARIKEVGAQLKESK